MTAPEPSAGHCDAMAGPMEGVEVCIGGRDDAGDDTWLWGVLDPGDRRSLARAILTSTDPAVHAAMLDALVRAGKLDAISWEPMSGEVAP